MKKIGYYAAALVAIYLVVAHPQGFKTVAQGGSNGIFKITRGFQGPQPGPGA